MTVATPRPVALVAELTHSCPLRCAYCSNPVELVRRSLELPTEEWERVLVEAEELGVLQVLFTGGEPLLRPDLEDLVSIACARGLYSTLITGGVPLTRARVGRLARAGLDAVQLSFQRDDVSGDAIAGAAAHARKLAAAGWFREIPLPLTVNVVLHRGNVDRVAELVGLAERLGADRLELASVQYLEFAYANRADLRPDAAGLRAARAEALRARQRLAGRMEIALVAPDERTETPGACMGGWGQGHLVVTPDGIALPCHAARMLPLEFPSVRDRGVAWSWAGAAFQAFRGEAWMPQPCRSCELRAVDRGGCRCRAFLAWGDPAGPDPACVRVPAPPTRVQPGLPRTQPRR